MEKQKQSHKLHHRGRIRQIPICLGKFFRMFLYLNDWKVLPMAALIAGLVSLVAANDYFKTMEGTLKGAFALACVCIWNGCFNSIQVICRERSIIKREHRAGMHISSYVFAHMIYQAFLCALQSGITVFMLYLCRIPFPSKLACQLTFSPFLDYGITFFLITYAADMTSLFLSAVVRNTTDAMTVMPFFLIFEILFSDFMFGLSGFAAKLTKFSLAKWGLKCLCAQADYNSQPMVTVWNQIFSLKNVEYMGQKPIKEFTDFIEQNHLVDQFNAEMGKNNINAAYAATKAVIEQCWMILAVFALVFAVLSILALEGIDKDKR